MNKLINSNKKNTVIPRYLTKEKFPKFMKILSNFFETRGTDSKKMKINLLNIENKNKNNFFLNN